MIIKNTPETAPKVAANLNGNIMFSNSKLESILLNLEPGQSIPAHNNPYDVLFIGMMGEAKLVCGQQEYSLLPFQTLFVSSDEPRSMQNATSSTARVMVVKILN
jgi:quercetin dioxygenase-like cupin family protein